ncbi:MAG: transposase [Candidatus Omnitrophota bacterium]
MASGRTLIEALIAAERKNHGERPPAARGPIPEGSTLKERMIRKLRTVGGRAAYALRKITVEPVFGQIRTRGLVRFWLRGLESAKAKWPLWCTTHNLL